MLMFIVVIVYFFGNHDGADAGAHAVQHLRGYHWLGLLVQSMYRYCDSESQQAVRNNGQGGCGRKRHEEKDKENKDRISHES